jgi:ribonuclease P/MRP protein subunit RPP1
MRGNCHQRLYILRRQANPVQPNPIPSKPFPEYPHIRFLSRITITIDDPAALNANLVAPAKNFDIIAARPQTEKALQWLGGNNNPDIDIISLDISQRLPFALRHGLFTNLLSRGIALEICYAAGIGDTAARRNIISNATGLVRATRGRGIIVSSEARRTADLRGPFDVINLATFWGLKQDVGMGDGQKVVMHSEARRLTYKGAVQVITEEIKHLEKDEENRPKRKVSPVELEGKFREKRRRRKK